MSAYSALILSKSPALYWRLGSGGGADQSGNGRNGTGAGGITIGGAPSLILDADAATTFDGIDDVITSTYNPFAAGQAFSVSVWVNRTNTAGDDVILGGTASFGPHLKFIGSSDGVAFAPDAIHVADVTWLSTGFTAGSTFHLGFTFDDIGDVSELFKDGVSLGTRATPGAYDASPGNLQIGAEVAANPYIGVMDEFAFFTTVLTASDFLAQYNQGITASGAATQVMLPMGMLGTGRV